MKGNTGKQGNSHRVLNTVLLFFIVIQILILLSTLMRIRTLQQQGKEIKEIKEATSIDNTRLYNLDYATLLETINKSNSYREAKHTLYEYHDNKYEPKEINYSYYIQTNDNLTNTVEIKAEKDCTTLNLYAKEGQEAEGLLDLVLGANPPIPSKDILETTYKNGSYHFDTDKLGILITTGTTPNIQETGACFPLRIDPGHMLIEVTQENSSALWDNERIMYDYDSQPVATLLWSNIRHKGLINTTQLSLSPDKYTEELKSEVESNFKEIMVTTIKVVEDGNTEIARRVEFYDPNNKERESGLYRPSQITYTLDFKDKQVTLRIDEWQEGDAKLIPSIYKEDNGKIGYNVVIGSLE